MAKGYVFYNPLAGHGTDKADIRDLELTTEIPLEFFDLTKFHPQDLLSTLEREDFIILCGGDGTLNRFINQTEGHPLENEILYLPTGNGNDFARELGKDIQSRPFPITEYLNNLPTVRVNGRSFRFLNGIGFGIDGYCCEEGDRQKRISKKKINYTAIAVKGLLFHYKPTAARVTVDGVSHTFEKVWLAPTMKGRFYGGGMIPTPAQNRKDENGRLSVMVLGGTGKLKTLRRFPSLFKGEHIKYTDMVHIFQGNEITVEFDRPTPLQIDGETISEVTSYTATAHNKAPLY